MIHWRPQKRTVYHSWTCRQVNVAFHSSLRCFLSPCNPSAPCCPSVYCPVHYSLLHFQLSQSAASPPALIYVNTVQYQIILLHGCVKWLGHPFGSSSLLTIFGCVSNPFSAQPWSCGSSAWRHCVSVDPYGAEQREGGTHSPPSTSYTHFARLGLEWDLGGGGEGVGENDAH